MVVIYISSTYEDLIKEREAAAQAVRSLEHSALRMEDYVASDKRPLDKCLEDVKKSDIYVGIFARRYGFIPDGYDKSITHLEYEAAGKKGIPRLIFLLDETAEWPDNYVSTGDEREKTNTLRQYLQHTHTVSFFTNPEKLAIRVTAAIANAFKDKKPKRGSIICKLCNRVPQVKRFLEFFLSKSQTYPKCPQFYFIHGDELAGHDSFLERLMRTYLKEFAEKEVGKEKATIKLEEVPWPKEGNLPDRQAQLRFNIMNQFYKWGRSTDFTAAALSRLPVLDKRSLVLIKHNIYSSKWDKHSEPLLTWYIKEYWDALECNEDIPLFLVFFNVKYQEPIETGLKQLLSRWTSYSKEDIKGQLEQIGKSSGDTRPCLLLDELTEVEIEDVLDWFDHNDIYDDELDRKEGAEAIFKDTVKLRIVKSRPMAKVERALKKIVEESKREDI
jgi:hypothetical protein